MKHLVKGKGDVESLTVRVYNVRFGDAVLISVPDRDGEISVTRHILIDVGNSLSTEGGDDFFFKPVVEDILAQLNGAPLDLYVMTHEHMDHIQGLFFANTKAGLQLVVNNAWLTASAEGDYYDREWPTVDEDGRPLKQPREARLEAVAAFADAEALTDAYRAGGLAVSPFSEMLLTLNNPRKSDDCVNYLRGLASPANTHYVYRDIDRLGERHPFQEATLELWAPEQNTALYYEPVRPVAFGVAPGERSSPAHFLSLAPPAGVDAGAFYQLVECRRAGGLSNLLAIDKAKNNSSVVLHLQWKEWSLLFPADAEIRSWQEMDKHGKLKPIHFLKISHHLSHNGTPDDELLNKLFPASTPDGRDRVAVASTFPDTYEGIPHPMTLKRFHERNVSTYLVHECVGDLPSKGTEENTPIAGYVDFVFPPDGNRIAVEHQVLPRA